MPLLRRTCCYGVHNCSVHAALVYKQRPHLCPAQAQCPMHVPVHEAEAAGETALVLCRVDCDVGIDALGPAQT